MAETADANVAVQVRVYGRVQGVWFRAWTVETACGLGLAGWVRNRGDGSVEALFVGAPGDVEAMVGKCRRGPPAARVDQLERYSPTDAAMASVTQGDFRQLPTL